MKKTNQLGLAAAAAILLGASHALPSKTGRKRQKGVIMAGTRTPGIRAPGLVQREADNFNANRMTKHGGTVGDHMKRAPRDTRTKASAFHHVKGNPPRAGWTYRADRRNQAKVSRGARPVEVGKKVNLSLTAITL